jgi:hypothetical protein
MAGVRMAGSQNRRKTRRKTKRKTRRERTAQQHGTLLASPSVRQLS